MARRKDDWKLWKTGWQYKTDAPQDKEWNKDRNNLFRKNGHGWWWDPTKAQSKDNATRKPLNK